MDVEQDLFEESQALRLHLLTLVKHFLHVLHVLGIVGIDLLQGRFVFLFGPLHFLFGFLDALRQFFDLTDNSNKTTVNKKLPIC